MPKFVLEEFVKVEGEEDSGSISDKEEELKSPEMIQESVPKDSLSSPLKLTKRKSSFYKTKSVIHCDTDFDKLNDHETDHAGL